MIRVIDGKRYNTDTAVQVAYRDSHIHTSNWTNETLYLTSKGAWFTWCEGGANSKYAELLEGGNSRRKGERLEPLTPEEAQSWLEEYGMTDKLEEYFSGSIEDA